MEAHVELFVLKQLYRNLLIVVVVWLWRFTNQVFFFFPLTKGMLIDGFYQKINNNKNKNKNKNNNIIIIDG
jgi:hypothetical protein